MLFFTHTSIKCAACNNVTNIIALVIYCSLAASHTSYAAGEQQTPKRIEVYSLNQNYWDIQPGDTLSNIVHHLLPNNPSKHSTLKNEIVHLNPQAFVNGNAELLLAGKRLHLPGYMQQADSIADPATTKVESYSWGNIKRQK